MRDTHTILKDEKMENTKTNTYGWISHEQNNPLFHALLLECNSAGLDIRHNRTCYGGFSGYHAYLLCKFQDEPIKIAINNKLCKFYTTTPYSKNYEPSIAGEAECLNTLIDYVSNINSAIDRTNGSLILSRSV